MAMRPMTALSVWPPSSCKWSLPTTTALAKISWMAHGEKYWFGRTGASSASPCARRQNASTIVALTLKIGCWHDHTTHDQSTTHSFSKTMSIRKNTTHKSKITWPKLLLVYVNNSQNRQKEHRMIYCIEIQIINYEFQYQNDEQLRTRRV